MYPSYRDQAQRGAVRLSLFPLLHFFNTPITILLCFVLFMQIDFINYAEVELASQLMLLDRGVRLPDAQQKETIRRIQGSLQRALRALTCCLKDDVPPIHLRRPHRCTQLAHRPLQHRTQRPAVLQQVRAVSPL